MKLLSLSSLIPEQIIDVVRFSCYEGEFPIDHFCGYASDFIAQVNNDNLIDGAVFPRSCDSCRTINSYIDEDKFKYSMFVPSVKSDSAVSFFRESICDYKKSIEQFFNIEINDIADRCQQVNLRNQLLRKIYENMDQFDYFDYLRCIHEMLQMPLSQQTVKTPKCGKSPERGRKRVFLIGSYLSNIEIARIIESKDLIICGDNLTESKRLFSCPEVNCSSDLFTSIAESIMFKIPSPTQNDFNKILKEDIEEMRAKDICGAIFINQQYCEPYDFIFPQYKRMLEDNGIKILHIKLADSTDLGNSELAIETFANML